MTIFPTGMDGYDADRADNYTPSVGMDNKRSFKVLRSGFGNGYEQVAVDGLNSASDTYTVSWMDIPIVDALAIKAYFNARGGNEAFLWAPPDEAQAQFKLPDGYSYRRNKTLNVATITAVFKSSFDN